MPAAPAKSPEPAPPAIGGYQLVERIGVGGMGEVWRGERVSAGSVRRRVAIKRILPEYQKDATLHGRFLAEAKINARMEHPNVVQVVDFGDQPELYLVLEFVEGLPLSELLGRAARLGGGLPLPAALYIVAEAATGLDYAHRLTDESGRALGIVHRDVSPSNVMVSVDGSVKVNDFGVAKAADTRRRTEAGVAVGKLVYMAPEQASGDALDHRADVFALGVVLWELLALQPLLPRNDPGAAAVALARCEFRKPSSVAPSVPPAVDAIVMEALARDPASRMPSAGRMAKALRTVLSSVAPGYDARDLASVVESLAPEVAARSARADLTRISSGGSPVPAGPVAPHAPYAPAERTPMAPAVARAAAAGPPPQGVWPPSPTQTVTAGPALVPGAIPPTADAARRPRGLWLAAAAGLVLLVAGGGVAVGVALSSNDGSSDPSSGTAPTVSPAGAGAGSYAQPQPAAAPGAAMRDVLTTMLSAGVGSCMAGQTGHGTVTVDVSYQPDGTPGSINVRVNEMNKTDQEMAECVRTLVAETQSQVTPGGFTVPTVVVSY